MDERALLAVLCVTAAHDAGVDCDCEACACGGALANCLLNMAVMVCCCPAPAAAGFFLCRFMMAVRVQTGENGGNSRLVNATECSAVHMNL